MWRVLHDNLLKAGGLLASRRRLVAALAVGIEIAFLVFFASRFKGLPQAGTLVTGAVVALVAWTAVVLAGPRVGVVAALSAGVTYGVLVTLPDGSGIAATAGSTVILTFTAYLTGTAADELRHKVLDRETLHATLEQSLLPRLRIDGPPAAVTTLYEPGEERLWLGGDFYDAVRFTDGRVALIVGDVSGRGRRAAALGATLRAGWRALTLAAFPLPATAETLRELLVAELATSETFVTACLALVEPWSRRLTFVNLGHPPPLLLGAAPVELAAPQAFPLGFAGGDRPKPSRHDLPPGWSLLFDTDGLVEGKATPGAAECFGIERQRDGPRYRGRDRRRRLAAAHQGPQRRTAPRRRGGGAGEREVDPPDSGR
jgi:hypothetical protein